MTGALCRLRHSGSIVLLMLASCGLSGCAWFAPPRHYSIKDSIPSGTRVASYAATAPAPASAPARLPVRKVVAATPTAGSSTHAKTETQSGAKTGKVETAVVEPPRPPQTAGVPATGCRDTAACDSLLRTLVESRDRSWILGPPTPQAHVSGVRMFAYRSLRDRLSCGELSVGVEEMRSVPGVLATAPAGTTVADVQRAVALAAAVQGELTAEQDRRCKGSPATVREASPPAPPAAPPQPPPVSAAPAPPPAAESGGGTPDAPQPADASGKQ